MNSKMKKLIVIIVTAVITGGTVQAQDIITLRNGDEIAAKVMEVGTDKIHYKKADNLSGPVYVVAKNTIFMIKYENGSKDVFEQIEATPLPAAGTNVKQTYSVKNPSLAWGLSFLVVGVGQFYNGDVLKGIGCMAGSGIGYLILRRGIEEEHSEKALAGLAIYLGSWIISMVDAPLSAKRKNRQNSFLSWNIGKDSYLSLYPDLKPVFAGNSLAAPSCGMGLKVKF